MKLALPILLTLLTLAQASGQFVTSPGPLISTAGGGGSPPAPPVPPETEPVPFQYDTVWVAEATTSGTVDKAVTLKDSTTLLLVAASCDNYWEGVDSCYVLGESPSKTQLDYQQANSIGTLTLLSVAGYRAAGEVTVRTKFSGSAGRNVMIAVFRGGSLSTPLGTASGSAGNASGWSLSPSSAAGDSVVGFGIHYYVSGAPTSPTRLVKTSDFYESSRKLVMFMRSGAGGGPSIGCYFDASYFGATAVSVKP